MHQVPTYALWSLGMAVLVYAPGYLLSQAPVLRALDGPSRWLGRVVLGLAAWLAALFTLCAVGAFHPRLVWLLCGLTLGGAAAVWLRTSSWRTIRAGWRRPPFVPEEALLSGTLTVTLAVLFLICLLPALAADAAVYHLNLPRRWLEAGGFTPVPYNVYSHWPLNLELLFALAMRLKDAALAKLVHWLFGLATLALLYDFTRRRGDRFGGLLAALLFLANPVVLFDLSVGYVDVGLAFFTLAAFCFLEDALRGGRRRAPRLLLAGIAAGLLAGTKLTGGVAAACLLPGYLLAAGRRDPPRLGAAAAQQTAAGAPGVTAGAPGATAGGPSATLPRPSLRPTLRELAVFFLLPAVALAAPWLVKSWRDTGNPVYPFLCDWFGGPEWSAALSTQLHDWHRRIGMGRGVADHLLLPFRVVLAGGPGYEHFDGRLHPLWLGLLPAAGWAARGRPEVRRLLLASLLWFVFWAATSQQMRFLIPILPLLSMAGALAVADGLARVASVRRRRGLAALAAAAAVGTLLGLAAGHPGGAASAGYEPRPRKTEPRPSGSGEPASAAEASTSRGDRFLTGAAGASSGADPFPAGAADGRPAAEIGADGVPVVLAYVNRELPPDARLLFLNFNEGFYCARAYWADSFFEASQMAELLRPARDAAELAARLRTLGVTHLLWHDRDRGIAWPPALGDLLADPALARPAYRTPHGRDTVYELAR